MSSRTASMDSCSAFAGSVVIIRNALLSIGIVAATSCGFYTMPTFDLVVQLDEAARADTVPDSLRQFARSKGLQEFELSSGAPGATYWSKTESRSRGISVIYFDLQPRCKVVRFLDKSEDWTPQSRSAAAELEQHLSRVDGARIERGNSLENWRETMKSPELYCANARVDAR